MAVLRTEMTHGDKAKAKTAKSSKASAPKASSKAGENGKGALKAGAESSKGTSKGPGQSNVQASPAKLRSGEKAAAGSRGGSAKELAAEGKGKGRAAAVAEDEAPFNNPVIADAFKHALKKYPNALRKLTD